MLSRVSKSKVITDVPSIGAINDYEELSSVLTGVIKNSDPQFTIGIYGEWGTGKTTLMNMVRDKLKETKETDQPKTLPVWFDAWRYEGEKQLAVIAILKTIVHEIEEYPETDDNFRKFKGAIVGITTTIIDIVSNMMGAGVSTSEIQKNISDKSKLTSGEEEPTIYFDLLNEIKKAMNEIRDKNKEFRMVVFVDDLDRCSPLKALRVLESIKIFFDISGFIYVLGISHETLSNLINQVYKKFGIEGREYIKKIIQVPITLPSWELCHMEKLLAEEISQMNPKHRVALDEKTTKEYILNVADNNPRQLKRLINSFIVAYDTYTGKKPLDVNILFRCLLIQKDKPKLFSEWIKNEAFREIMTEFIEEMEDIDDITHRHPRKSKSETITSSRLPILRLVMKIHDAWRNEIKEKEQSNKIKNELRTAIRVAFYEFLEVKYESKFDKSEKSKNSNQENYQSELAEIRKGFYKVVESDELTMTHVSRWVSLKDGLTKIGEKGDDPIKYTNAINMMREDLKMDPDSRNLNKN